MRRTVLQLLVLLGAVVAAARPQWYDKEAPLRLLVPAPAGQGGDLRIDLPPAAEAVARHVTVRLPNGDALLHRAIVVDGFVRAVEIDLARQALWRLRRLQQGDDPLAAALHVYVFTSPVESAPAELTDRQPVHCERRYARVIARPTTGAEYAQFLWRQRGMRTAAHLAAFPDADHRAIQYVRPTEKLDVHYRFSAMLIVREPQHWRFAVANEDCGAWFVSLGGKSIFTWARAAEATPRYIVSAAVSLKPGLHRLELTGILGEGEELPTLLHQRGPASDYWLPLAPESLATGDSTTGVVFEAAEPGLTPGFDLQLTGAYAFPAVDRVIGLATVGDLSSGPIASRELAVDDLPRPAAFTDGRVFLTQRRRHNVRLTLVGEDGARTELLATPALGWDDVGLADATFDLASMPLIEPPDLVLRLPYRVTWSGRLPDDFVTALRVRSRIYDHEGQVLRETLQPIDPSPWRRFVEPGELPAKTRRLELALVVGPHPVAPPVVVHRLSPDEPRLAFAPAGDRLRFGGGFVLLRRLYERETPIPVVGSVDDLVLVDEMIAPCPAPGDSLDVSAWLAANTGLTARHLPLGADPQPVLLPRLAKFPALARALADPAPAVALLVGRRELDGGTDLRDFSATMRWLVEACLDHGKTPILATLPPRPGDSAARVRAFSLRVKELAAEYGVPVVDYYAQSQLAGDPSPVNRDLDAPTPVRTASPDTAGRRWLLERLAAALAAHRNSD